MRFGAGVGVGLEGFGVLVWVGCGWCVLAVFWGVLAVFPGSLVFVGLL